MTLTSPAPACGYVRFPQDWLYLPISPQAKTLLQAFCGYANEEGESWFSYEQLGLILNRSKSSVCAYVKELRETGLVSCTRQTYGNGYNYRLRIKIVGWAEMVARWAAMSARKAGRTNQAAETKASERPRGQRKVRRDADQAQCTQQQATRPEAEHAENSERRVRHAERKDPSGPRTQIHKTHTYRDQPRVVWNDDDERAWRSFRPSDRDPPSSGFGRPDTALLRKAQAVATALGERIGYLDAESRDLEALEAIRSFVERRGLEAGEQHLAEAASALAGKASTRAAIAAAIAALDAAWKPYWRRMSMPRQMLETVSPAIEAALPDRGLRDDYTRFMGRSLVATMILRATRSA